MARDATARLYDVDAERVTLDQKTGIITFQARTGRRVDLDKLHESLWATRLGDRTGMELHWLEVTATGVVETAGQDVVLKVPGSEQPFVLVRDPKGEAPFQRLQEALKRGEKVVTVTGRMDGWTGNFTKLLSQLPTRPRRIVVKEFQTAQ